jgi:hypothetical protein
MCPLCLSTALTAAAVSSAGGILRLSGAQLLLATYRRGRRARRSRPVAP